ncbi:MAG: DUF4783 domain-containing protein [Ignavibacteria bacterium]|nr:DUF4783 domain-containing protein [Ignavibacteria bacterium]MDH7527021.1 DUF4783 domain-containing protein [Ignavibacteria bacterium]
MRTKIYLVIICLMFTQLVSDLDAQKRSKIIKQFSQENQKIEKSFPLPETEFENIINGLSSGDINKISRHFAPQIYLSLRSGERGYHSSNQAYYLIDNFFRIYSPINFQIISRMMEGSMPYLSGKLFCRFKGSIETYQVYLNLNWNGSKWEITQISIN